MRPEQKLHLQIAQYLTWALAPPTFWTTIPLGGGGEMRGKILASLGAKRGVPDIMIIYRGFAHWIELKSARGNVSAAQSDCHKALAEAGCPPIVVARSLDEVRGALWNWGIPLRERKPSAVIIGKLAKAIAADDHDAGA